MTDPAAAGIVDFSTVSQAGSDDGESHVRSQWQGR